MMSTINRKRLRGGGVNRDNSNIYKFNLPVVYSFTFSLILGILYKPSKYQYLFRIILFNFLAVISIKFLS